MPPDRETLEFIRSTFRSVWTLELLLLLRKDLERSWTPRDLVNALRGSDLIVSRSLEELLAAGLVVSATVGATRYNPVTRELNGLVEAAATLYARKPNAVRRAIIAAHTGGLAAFANAFKLRGELP